MSYLQLQYSELGRLPGEGMYIMVTHRPWSFESRLQCRKLTLPLTGTSALEAATVQKTRTFFHMNFIFTCEVVCMSGFAHFSQFVTGDITLLLYHFGVSRSTL